MSQRHADMSGRHFACVFQASFPGKMSGRHVKISGRHLFFSPAKMSEGRVKMSGRHPGSSLQARCLRDMLRLLRCLKDMLRCLADILAFLQARCLGDVHFFHWKIFERHDKMPV